MLQGQQSRYTKFLLFFCEYDRRDKAKHWIEHYRPERISRTPGHKNIFNYALVDFSNLILLPLHLKLGLIKQYVKALNKQDACFQYIANKFPKLSGEKVKEGIFVGPQIRQL